MIRVVKMGWLWYATEIVSIEEDLENIEVFVNEDTSVLLCYDLEKAKEILDTDDVVMV